MKDIYIYGCINIDRSSLNNLYLLIQFMQRSLEKEQQEQLEKERKRIITESEWVLEYENDEIQKP